jgi:hypothetical protein
MELPVTDRVADAIYATYKNDDEQREYLGASIIGGPCKRQLWYSFRWAVAPSFDGRVLRLFDSGKREELRLIEELRKAGMTVYDNEDGKQIGFREGHFGGSCDGVVEGVPGAEKTPHVFEAKTHNLKSFGALKKDGVKKSKPVHYGQMQTYMGKLELTRALYVAVCKDTDEIYTERVSFDKAEYTRLCKVADFVIGAEIPPDRVSEDPAWFECKFCPFADVCHGETLPVVSCRSCSHATPKGDGTWHCEQWNDTIPSVEAQRVGCDKHLYIPQLVSFGEVADAGSEYVVYRHRTNDQHFVNGTSFEHSDDNEPIPVYSSAELRIAGASGAADGMLHALKAEFGATVERYEPGKSPGDGAEESLAPIDIGTPEPMPKQQPAQREGRLLWHEASETLWVEKDTAGYKEAMESGECDDVTGIPSWEQRFAQQCTEESGSVAA